jgi:hypothetical protein
LGGGGACSAKVCDGGQHVMPFPTRNTRMNQPASASHVSELSVGENRMREIVDRKQTNDGEEFSDTC